METVRTISVSVIASNLALGLSLIGTAPRWQRVTCWTGAVLAALALSVIL